LYLNAILYFTYPFSAIYIITISLGLGGYLTRKFGLGWRLYWIGAATFILSQVGHIPFNAGLTALFRNGILPTPPDTWQLGFNAVVLGLSAGLFEEISRYAAYRWWARDARSWRRGLLLGAGHGGIEALLVGGLILATFLVMFALKDADLTSLVPGDQLPLAKEQVEAYWSATWYDSLIGAIERTFTLPAHLALSILVLQVFLRRQSRWLWFAVGWHTLLNALTLIIAGTLGIYLAELFLGILALINLFIIFRLRQPEPDAVFEPVTQVEATGPELFHMPEIDETDERLDQTRYQE
jgi:uncharacterized membrane protein YhfC